MIIDYKWIERELREFKYQVLEKEFSVEYLLARLNGDIENMWNNANEDEKKYLTYIKERVSHILKGKIKDKIRIDVLEVLYGVTIKARIQGNTI